VGDHLLQTDWEAQHEPKSMPAVRAAVDQAFHWVARFALAIGTGS
jgi:hypothetical protein